MMQTSWVGNVLNPIKLAEMTEMNNLIYGMGLDIMTCEIEKEEEKANVLVLIDQDVPLNIGLYYYFSQYYLYPHESLCSDLIKRGLSPKTTVSEIRQIVNENDYIICFDKCDIFSEYMINEEKLPYNFLLLKVTDESFEKKIEIGFRIEDYYNYFKQNDMIEKFDYYINYFYNNVKYYNDPFSTNNLYSLIQYFHNNNLKEETFKYYNTYLKVARQKDAIIEEYLSTEEGG